MPKKIRDYSIIFMELDNLSNEPEVVCSADELDEFEKIRVLREIVIEMNTPVQIYHVST